MVGGVVTTPGNLKENKTGSWRSFRPVIDQSKCISCGMCRKFCPDVCIDLTPKATVDYDYCKGCLLCVTVCPVKCISSKEEEK